MDSSRFYKSLLTLLISAGTAAHAGDLTLSTGLDYSSGKYGSTASTDILYLPLTMKYESGKSTFKATLPYLRVTAPSGGTIVTVDGNGQVIYSGSGPRATEEGLGDMTFSYSYSLFEQPRNGFLVDLIGKFKLATADEAKGLGSGKNDLSAQVDLYYLAGSLSPFMTLGYRMPGSPTGLTLRDLWYGTLGLGYRVSPENSVGLMWDLRQASRSGGKSANEMTLYWVHKLAPDLKLQIYAAHGFSDASADQGLGLMVLKTF